MKIAILGLGYVGTTTAACLAKIGHHVLGVDINPEKVGAIGSGRSPVVEPQVEELLALGHRAGRVTSSTSLEPWLDGLDLTIVCVGTPSRADGKLDLTNLLEVTRQLGPIAQGALCRGAAPSRVPQHRATRDHGATRPTNARAGGG